MLVLQSSAELFLADSKGLRIWIGFHLIPEHGAELDQRAKRRLARLLQLRPEGGRNPAENRHDLSDELAPTAQHAEGGVHEDGGRQVDGCLGGVKKTGSRFESGDHGGYPAGLLGVASGQQGVQRLQEVRQPERRVLHLGSLVLQPKDRASDLSQESRAIDLTLNVWRLQLLDGAGD